MAKDEKDACYQILSFGLWWTSIIYKTRLFLAKKFTLELFWRTIYSTIKRRILCWITYFLEENIEISEKINEDIAIEEEYKIKIVEEINEGLIIEKDLEVEIVETIKEEII